MDITYIEHSGFLMEWETCYWLFDYYKGTIPELDKNKNIFVFASHKHEDHFNPVIFKLSEKYPDTRYILSSDIKLTPRKIEMLGITDDILEHIVFVKPYHEYSMSEIDFRTLKSTDCGVAFLIHYQGKTIYHAGDLNLWIWKEETKQYNNNMNARFCKEMEALKDVSIDIAFVPLDPRLEENYYLGMESLINTAKIKYVFPMHFQGNESIIEKFKRERTVNIKNTEIMEINQCGQKWKIEI